MPENLALNKKLFILGIRGLPAMHGGFETFAERLALHLVGRGWNISVYCQVSGSGKIYSTSWQGIKLIHVPVKGEGSLSTIYFDWKCILHALSQHGLFLTLGYNTAVFNILQRCIGQVNVINMDGIEWRRQKWGRLAKAWFWLNERIACWVGSHLVADHPKIKEHLATRIRSEKITMIPYGGDCVLQANVSLLVPFGLRPNGFSVIIARPEPENSILEMVRAFSSSRRDHMLVVLGNFDWEKNAYHALVKQAASAEVLFPGAIYDIQIVQSLRFYSKFYMHGHRVGGTNPSLVEALGAQCAVIAHDNEFNRWVAGDSAAYFDSEQDCSQLFDTLLSDEDAVINMKSSGFDRYRELFTWPKILTEYEELLIGCNSKK